MSDLIGIDIEVCRNCKSKFVKKATAINRSGKVKTYLTCSLFKNCKNWKGSQVRWESNIPGNGCPIPKDCPNKNVHLANGKTCIYGYCMKLVDGIIENECPYLKLTVEYRDDIFEEK